MDIRQFTPAERLGYYQQAIEVFRGQGPVSGLCWVLVMLSRNYMVYERMNMVFPELWAQRPATFHDSDYWWDLKNVGMRIAALEAAIKIVENNLSKNLDN